MAGQKLINSEIDSRVVIRPSKTIKRVDDGVNGIMFFGENNDYPQMMEKIINGSVTAKACSNVYSKFLAGAGFEAPINEIVVGKDVRGKEITIQKLLRFVTSSISKHSGAYIQCNYTREGKIANVHVKPFKNCRFALTDDVNYTAKILIYDNWAKDKENGKKYDPKLIKDFNVFNPNLQVIQSQIKKAGDLKKYKGQIYFLFTDDEFLYPLSMFDESYLDCDTEAQLGLFRNRQTRNGFFKKTILRIQESLSEGKKKELADSARRSLGVDGDGLWIIEDELNENGEFSDRQGFAFDQLDSALDDDKFREWDPKIANNIRKSAKGMPAILIDYEENKLSTPSAEAMVQATNYFNAITKDDRKEISEAFKEIFTNFINPTLAENTNWNIKPLAMVEQKQGEQVDQAELERIKSQALLKGSVGGVTALLDLQKAVTTGAADVEAAVEIVKEIYGIPEDKARKMIGTPKIIENGGSVNP